MAPASGGFRTSSPPLAAATPWSPSSSPRGPRPKPRAVGCRVDQIAKSLVFRGENTQGAVLVITSGATRGVAPVAHAEPLTILIDEDLMQWPEIWAAAGHPNTVFKL